MCATNASHWPPPEKNTRIRRTDLPMTIETDPVLGMKLKSLGFPHTSSKQYFHMRGRL